PPAPRRAMDEQRAEAVGRPEVVRVADLHVSVRVGSGASTGALARYLRTGPGGSADVELVGVQPYGSVTFGAEHVSDPEIIIAGIGSSIPFGNVAHELYDTLHWISFDAALAGGVDLLRRHAVFAGLSAGAGYLAARHERGRAPERTVVFVAADTGHRYVDSVYARHREAVPVDGLVPREVTATGELSLPWSRMRWNRRPDPQGVRACG
ncbi:pyridoxal-phosphate dependent enzyme, partial [Streptomyces sp. NPDC127110]|uniref:pyridoxal-phosphate dependent enzyme n=1 Tax=Streptomyces sp. NPDC127110 TaxID=3345362 RepID=UPI00363101CA